MKESIRPYIVVIREIVHHTYRIGATSILDANRAADDLVVGQPELRGVYADESRTVSVGVWSVKDNPDGETEL